MNLKQKWLSSKDKESRVHYEDRSSHFLIVKSIKQYLPGNHVPLVIVCIGTDRSTGDALGPLVGSQLQERQIPGAHIYGTLENPVHAVNLEETLADIQQRHESPFIIGIDACLGKHKNIGTIAVNDGPVLPGAGVNKKLLPVGDMNITGIVNVSGYMEYFVLQNTRLNLVMSLARVISDCLHLAIISRSKNHFSTKLSIK